MIRYVLEPNQVTSNDDSHRQKSNLDSSFLRGSHSTCTSSYKTREEFRNNSKEGSPPHNPFQPSTSAAAAELHSELPVHTHKLLEAAIACYALMLTPIYRSNPNSLTTHTLFFTLQCIIEQPTSSIAPKVLVKQCCLSCTVFYNSNLVSQCKLG